MPFAMFEIESRLRAVLARVESLQVGLKIHLEVVAEAHTWKYKVLVLVILVVLVVLVVLLVNPGGELDFVTVPASPEVLK